MKMGMSSTTEVTNVFILLSVLSAESFVISPKWSHLRWKTVGPALVDVRRSGEVTLSCSATGSPAPALAWYKDGLFTPHLELGQEGEGTSLGETVAKLRLPCITDTMTGKYECRARAGKHEMSVVTEVTISDWGGEDLCSETGDPQVGVWSPTLMVEEGRTALLRCRAMEGGKEKVKTVWRNEEGKELEEGERHSITPEGDLIIRHVNFADMGTYTCNLANSMGSDSVSTFLYPLAPSTSI